MQPHRLHRLPLQEAMVWHTILCATRQVLTFSSAWEADVPVLLLYPGYKLQFAPDTISSVIILGRSQGITGFHRERRMRPLAITSGGSWLYGRTCMHSCHGFAVLEALSGLVLGNQRVQS